MPSTAADAAGLLNAAFASGRPTLFFYPKSCLNDRDHTTSPDVGMQLAIPGKARLERSGRDLTFVAWGNTVGLCVKAADALELAGVQAEIIDLRSLAPWDRDLVLRSVNKTGRLVVVHEDNHTCGFGAEVVATVAEHASRKVEARRLTRPDTYVPCNFGNQLDVLPSFRRTLETAAGLLDLEVTWEVRHKPEPGLVVVDAMGSSPSDESALVLEWHIKPGETVELGQMVAILEADKALVEMDCPVAGVVVELLAAEGESVKIGAPLFTIRTPDGESVHKPVTQENPGRPVLRRPPHETRTTSAKEEDRTATVRSAAAPVGIGAIAVRKGSRLVHNDALLPGFTREHYTSEDIIRLTGIENRVQIGDGETALSMAVDAAREALGMEGLAVTDLDAIICSTGTPRTVTPSMACLILNALTTETGHVAQAHDVNAACSGYLYALQTAYDWLQHRPAGRVLVITTEVLSPLLDPGDFSTAIIFGDAATATIVSGGEHLDGARAGLKRPELSAKGDPSESLLVPFPGGGCVRMTGRRVFSEAVRMMVSMLKRACQTQGIAVDDLDLLVPHQANQRIIDAIRDNVDLPPERVFSNIRHLGNTSSNTIPIALAEILPVSGTGERLGLCAFGGGFTFGAGVIEVL
jgi:2-oxoisovalerate dehydrogenase E1 component